MSQNPNAASYLDGLVTVQLGDITLHDVDAIVNAANTSLMSGGGVNGAIHRRGESAIIEACEALRQSRYPRGLPFGDAVMTTGGDLLASHVIHTVGPIYGRHNGQEPALLASCYARSLEVAREAGVRTIAFPAISTGIFGYPRAEAAQVVSDVLRRELVAESILKEVRLVFADEEQMSDFIASCTLT